VVLSYGLSVIDMAMILGPSNPPTLAVLVARSYTNPDLQALLPASAGAVMVLGLVVIAGLLMAGLQVATARAGRVWLGMGGRGMALSRPVTLGAWTARGLFAGGAAAMLGLGLWSLAWRWPWPALLPQSYSLQSWAQLGVWSAPTLQTLAIAGASTGLALVLSMLWLASADQHPKARRFEILFYIPLLLPQISFLFGMNILSLRTGLNGALWPVIWGHGLFVFPYVLIALAGPWRAMDMALMQVAAGLGAGVWRRFWRVRMPILLAPICAAAAIGIAVSVAQYLPTLFLGAGRIDTLTTETLALAAGANRRATAVVAALQAALPLLGFAIAAALPALWHRNRRALSGVAAI